MCCTTSCCWVPTMPHLQVMCCQNRSTLRFKARPACFRSSCSYDRNLQGLAAITSNPVISTGIAGLATSANAQATIPGAELTAAAAHLLKPQGFAMHVARLRSLANMRGIRAHNSPGCV